MPITLSDLYTKIDVEPYGTLELLDLMSNDISWLADPLTKILPARTFAVHLIQSHLIIPTLDLQTVNQWPDDLLAFVATQWLKDIYKQLEDNGQTLLSFEEFKEGFYAYKDVQVKEAQDLLDTTFQSISVFTV